MRVMAEEYAPFWSSQPAAPESPEAATQVIPSDAAFCASFAMV